VVDGNQPWELFDQTDVAARPLARVAFARSFRELGTTAMQLYAPSAPVVIALEAEDGERLVDEGLEIVGLERVDWDTALVPQLAPGVHEIEVHAAGQVARVPLEVAPQGPDRLTIESAPLDGPAWLSHGACFGSYLGARYLHSAWSFTLQNADELPSSAEGCVRFQARKVGAVTIEARAREPLSCARS